MAKVKTETTENAAASAVKPAKEKKAAKPKTRKVTSYLFRKEPPEGVKIAPQLAIIIGHIKAAGNKGISLEDLATACKNDEKFQTRQPEARVITYYTPLLKEHDIVTVSKEEVEVAADAKAEEKQAEPA